MQQEIDEWLSNLKGLTIEEYYGIFGVVEQWLEALEHFMEPKQEHKIEITKLCEGLTKELSACPVWVKLHILSFCMKCSEKVEYAELLMQEVLNADYDILGEYNKYFLYWQISSCVFQNTSLQSESVELSRTALYRELYDAFCRVLHVEQYEWIPLEQRNQDLVFLFTSQFLQEAHAPTKTVYDRAYFLQKYLGKAVLIVNTAMMIPVKGDTPFYDRKKGSYLPEYQKLREIEFRGEKFGFFQCEDDMPNLNTMHALLQKIQEAKPYCIISVGDGDLCADLCGKIVPQIAIGTVFSEVAVTTARYQVIAKEPEGLDYNLLKILGVKPENVIKELFTFVFKQQQHHFTREELGLSGNGKILLVTGWRLGHEAEAEFLHMLEEIILAEEMAEVVFMGLFEGYEKAMEEFPKLLKKSHYFPYQEDALAVTECCDIYVNPKRRGGGSSSAEALFMGLPAVTLPFGDVAAAVGENFWVNDYEEMKNRIRRFCQDEKFYSEMSLLARQRAKDLTDSKTHFCELFREIEQREDFW